uniref:Uncharacterized protein n=1 Tax=Panagrolaimus sp. PS1159 TaxID=55785 RepID=A0AC35FMM3_9BILA
MKFCRSILLFFLFLLSTFVNADPKKCAFDNKCYWKRSTKLSGIQTKECDDGICYAFKCIQSEGFVIHGSGCYEDFVNTCHNIQPSITENSKGNENYKYHDENVIVVSCGDANDCAQTELIEYETKHAKKGFESKHKLDKEESEDECKNFMQLDKTKKPTVQCKKWGECFTGTVSNIGNRDAFDITCYKCAHFMCGDENGRVMVGSGCLNDFEKICKNIPATEIQKIKANKESRYFYTDNNTIFVNICSFADNCQFALPIEIYPVFNEMSEKFNKRTSDKTCKYEPLPGPNENGSNGYKLSGIFMFGFILFYLW